MAATWEQLTQAIEKSDLEEITRLLEVVDLNSPKPSKAKDQKSSDRYQFDLLSTAIEKKQLDIIKLFVETGFKLNYKNLKGKNIFFSDNTSLLVKAVEAGDKKIVEFLLRKGVNVNGLKGETSPLHCAAQDGQEEIVKLLLNHDASVNRVDDWKETPLHCAALKGHLGIIKLLCEHGASTDKRNDDSCLPMDNAARASHKEAFLYLFKRTDICLNDMGFTIFYAAIGGDPEIFRVLLDRGVHVDAICTRFMETALHIVSLYGPKKLLEFLIERGADVNAKDWRGYTPLKCANSRNKSELAEILKRHGARL